MNVGYRVELNEAERDELRELLSGGEQPVRKLKRAHWRRMPAGVTRRLPAVSEFCEFLRANTKRNRK